MGRRKSKKSIKATTKGATPPFESVPDRNTGLILTGVISILLATLVWIVFGRTLGHDFVNFDDNDYVYGNRLVTAGLTSDGIRWALTGVHSNNWHPLTTFSHMIDCQIYGVVPKGHHATNVLLHMAAAIFLFLALRRLTDALWLSAVVAALFAVHPLRVESVAWIAERKDVLSGVFFMLVLWAYSSFARSNRASPGRYILVAVLFALGLMCKPTLVTLPFVLLLLDYWPLRRVRSQGGACSWSYLILEKIPLALLAVAACVMTILAQQKAMLPAGALTFWERVGNGAIAYIVYIVQTLYPANLAVIYPFPPDHVNVVQAFVSIFLLIMVSGAFFVWRKKYPFLLIGWLWFLGMLVPMIGLVQVGAQSHADRYTYLPQIGLFLLMVWGGATWAAEWRLPRELPAGVALVTVAAFAVVSYNETTYWQNSETLWHHALADTVRNHIAESKLGDALLMQDRFQEAKEHYQNALEIFPQYASVANNLGYVLWKEGKRSEAIVLYQKALQFSPEMASAHTNLGVALRDAGNATEAVKHYREALRTNPGNVEARYNLADALVDLGQRDEALVQLREAFRLAPNNEDVRTRLRALGAP